MPVTSQAVVCKLAMVDRGEVACIVLERGSGEVWGIPDLEIITKPSFLEGTAKWLGAIL